MEFGLARDRFRAVPRLHGTNLDECFQRTHLSIHLQMKFEVVQLLLLGLLQFGHKPFRALLEVSAVDSDFLDFQFKFGDEGLELQFCVALFTVLNYPMQVALHHVAEFKFERCRLHTARRLQTVAAGVVLLIRV